jgi:hypothetical protein
MVAIAAADGATAEDLKTATTVVLAAQLVQSVYGSAKCGSVYRLVSVQAADANGSSLPLDFCAMTTTSPGISDDLSTIESAGNKLSAELRAALGPATALLRAARTADDPDLYARAGAMWRQAVQRLAELRAASEETAHVYNTDEDDADVEVVVNTLMAVAARCSEAAAAAAATGYLLAAAEAAAAGLLTAPLPVHPFSVPTRETLAELDAAASRLLVSFAEETAILQPVLRDAQLVMATTGVASGADAADAGAARRRPAAAASPAPGGTQPGAGAGCSRSAENEGET